LMPVYEQRLRDWKLPPSLHPEATLVDGGAVSELTRLIECSADRDFLIPESLRPALATDDHVVTAAAGGNVFLLAKKSSRRDSDSIAPGTIISNPPQ
jgi:hypothetical protein